MGGSEFTNISASSKKRKKIKNEKGEGGGNKKIVSGALVGKMLLVRIVKNDKIDAYFKAG